MPDYARFVGSNMAERTILLWPNIRELVAEWMSSDGDPARQPINFAYAGLITSTMIASRSS